MSITVTGVDGLLRSFDRMVDRVEKRVGVLSQQATRDLVVAMMENIPVWSGRTVESITVSNTGAVAPLQGDPSPSEIPGFGRTVVMNLGEEPMRAQAEAQALSSIGATTFDGKKPVFITVHSEAWGLVNRGQAPDRDRARNQGVVSEIALGHIRSKYEFLK